jgi:BlaI family transcriptional regulator, penicillinase repressor
MAPKSRMGELERAVMEVLWSPAPDGGWWTVRDVHAALAARPGRRDSAYTTVMTVLQRMAGKGLVEQQRDGRAYHYRAGGSREEMTAGLMRDALDEFASDDRRTALVAFVGEASAADRDALREALAALEAAERPRA